MDGWVARRKRDQRRRRQRLQRMQREKRERESDALFRRRSLVTIQRVCQSLSVSVCVCVRRCICLSRCLCALSSMCAPLSLGSACVFARCYSNSHLSIISLARSRSSVQVKSSHSPVTASHELPPCVPVCVCVHACLPSMLARLCLRCLAFAIQQPRRSTAAAFVVESQAQGHRQ